MAEPGPLSGRTLGGRYRLGELLGKGSVGVVYTVEDLWPTPYPQVIKVLLEKHLYNGWFRKRFVSEAEKQARLAHPHIIAIQDFGIEGYLPYLVMPYLKGGTLQGVLDRMSRPLMLDEIARYLEQICPALDYLHQHGLAHLALKPGNVLIDASGKLLLSDFGLVRPAEQGKGQAGLSQVTGTPLYMAPEHVQGQPEQRSDVYSVGMILNQMLRHRAAIKTNIPLQATRPDLPVPALAVLKRALAPLPEDRYQTAGELLEAFQAALRFRPGQRARRAAPL